MKRKKILFIARWYPDKNDNMLGLFVQMHARAVQLHNDVTVIYVTADSSIKPGVKIIDEQNHFGIHEIRIYFGKKKTEPGNALEYIKCYHQAIKLAEKNSGKFDLVHVHVLSRTALPAIWMKLTSGIPYIITEHWSRYLPVNLEKGSYNGLIRKWFTRRAVSLSSGVTTVTKNLADAMQKLGLKNTWYITPNIADIHNFYPEKEVRPKTIKKLVHVSCFDEPAKNIKGIINAVSELSKTRNDFIIEIIGDGKDFELVKNYGNQTGLVNSGIFFTGLLTGEELSEKMRAADAFVMFSNYENLPCTIVESITSGVPVVSTNVGGISEHLLPEFGVLIPPGDEKALIHAIIKMLDHPELYNKDKMREYAIKNFSIEASGKLFEEIYQKVLMT